MHVERIKYYLKNMTWAIIIIGVVLYIVFRLNKNKKENVKTVVTNYGGMLNKYSELISFLKLGGCKIYRVTEDSVILGTMNMKYFLDIVGDELEIRLKGFVPILGNVSHKWIYPHQFPQEKIIHDIENYMSWQLDNINEICERTDEAGQPQTDEAGQPKGFRYR